MSRLEVLKLRARLSFAVDHGMDDPETLLSITSSAVKLYSEALAAYLKSSSTVDNQALIIWRTKYQGAIMIQRPRRFEAGRRDSPVHSSSFPNFVPILLKSSPKHCTLSSLKYADFHSSTAFKDIYPF